MRLRQLFGVALVPLALVVVGSACKPICGVGSLYGSACGEDGQLLLNHAPAISKIEISASQPAVNEAVSLTAVAEDPDLDSLYYEWDFDGDGRFDRAGYDERVLWRFVRGGWFPVTVRVSDFPSLPGGEGRAVATRRVRVHTAEEAARNRPPIPRFTVRGSRAGESIVFDASGTTDPDGHQITSYRWAFTDFGFADAYGQVVTWRFPADAVGVRTVRLVVEDEIGATASVTSTIVLLPPQPSGQPPHAVLQVSQNPTVVGREVLFQADHSTDPDDAIEEIWWDLDGDGSFEAHQLRGDSDFAYMRHTYTRAGQVTTQIIVFDGHGNSDRAELVVRVNPRVCNPPACGRRAAAGREGAVRRGQPFSAVLSGRTLRTVGSLRLRTDGRGRMRARLLDTSRGSTRAERTLRRFLNATWRSRLRVTVDRRRGRITSRGIVVAVAAGTRARACLALRLVVRRGVLPTGTFRVIGGTRTAARLRGTGSFRFRVDRSGTAALVGHLRASRGTARRLPSTCRNTLRSHRTTKGGTR